MSELKAFKPTGKTCRWPDCNNEAVKVKFDVGGKSIHCIKHQLRKHSGRVGCNYDRDHYREHLKSVCALSGHRWIDQYHETKRVLINLGRPFDRIKLVRRTCQAFDVDHIDGMHHNNDPSNLQTLTKWAHKLKTDECGDSDPRKRRVK